MEIVHIVRQYSPSIGGLEDAVHNLCFHLNQNSTIKARVVTLNRVFSNPKIKLPRHEIIDGVDITRISYTGSSRYPLAPQVLQEIKSADIVHVHAVDFFFDYLALTRWLHGKPLIASTHGGFFHSNFVPTLKKVWFHTITRLTSTAYSYLCGSSDNDTKTFTKIASRKTVTVENGVNVSKWRDCASDAPQRVMIFIGRWSENKAIPVLIQLIAALKAHGAIWTLIIAGLPGAETVESLSHLVKELDIVEQVQIFEKPNSDEIGDLIGQASYIASASRYEGFGISIIEGLSAGLVPLLSPIPPFEKILDALKLGTKIFEGDLKRTAQSMEEVHKQLVISFSATKQQCIEFASLYNWGGVSNHFILLYQKMLGNPNREGRK